MSRTLSIPGELMPAFWQFKQDFERVAAQWVVWGHETEETMDAARDGLRRCLADLADPDEHGVSRWDRLRNLFAYWRELAGRVCPHGVAVVPVAALSVEVRLMDREWKRRGGR